MTTGLVRVLVGTLAICVCAVPASAQRGDSGVGRGADTARVGSIDSLYARARRLVLEGNGDAGRALVDSLLTAAAGTPAYADALYWRAALAATAADAERDYRRLIVEHPFSAHAGDALLALAQLEMARGDREPAIDHLQRFLLQGPQHSDRVRAGVWLGRLQIERNQVRKGCAVLLRTRATLGNEEVEIRNQLDYYAARCVGVDTTPPAPRPTAAAPRPNDARVPPRDSVRRDTTPREPVRRDTTRRETVPRDTARRDTTRPASVRRDTTRPAVVRRDTVRPAPVRPDSTRPPTPPPATAAASAGVRYTVQVAAYDTRAAAEQLIQQLAGRGITARLVEGADSLFRVRVGSYATEAQATAAARDLKAKGLAVFVTTTERERSPATVRP